MTIRDHIPEKNLDDTALIDFICTSTNNLLKEIIRLLNEDSQFQDIFLEKLKHNGRKMMIFVKTEIQDPFTRFKENAIVPTLELYIPIPKNGTDLNTVASLCGGELPSSIVGLSDLDPLKHNQRSDSEDYLPRVKDLPRPGFLCNQGPIYIRIIETIGESFNVEGNPAVVELIYEYILLHKTPGLRLTLNRDDGGKSVSFLTVTNLQSFANRVCKSPLTVVNLLENSLGFTRIGEPLAVQKELVWLFQRPKPFRFL